MGNRKLRIYKKYFWLILLISYVSYIFNILFLKIHQQNTNISERQPFGFSKAFGIPVPLLTKTVHSKIVRVDLSPPTSLFQKHLISVNSNQTFLKPF